MAGTLKHRPRLLLGLTGGIGSGKTTVANMLADMGVQVVDADRIARSVTEPGGKAIDAIRCVFGAEFIDGTGAMNRGAMRQKVFGDPVALGKLEAITHPLIGQEIAHVVSAQSPDSVVALDIPLLVESKRWPQQLDAVMVVDCSVQTQMARVKQRNGWPDETVQAIVRSQASREQRLSVADVVISNDGISLAVLNSQLQGLRSWLQL